MHGPALVESGAFVPCSQDTCNVRSAARPARLHSGVRSSISTVTRSDPSSCLSRIQNESLNRIGQLLGNTMLIATAGRQGRLLQGSAERGFVEYGRYPDHFLAMAKLHDRVVFAGGRGATVLFGSDVKTIRDTFTTIAVWPSEDRLFFIPGDLRLPQFIEHNPRHPKFPRLSCAYRWWPLKGPPSRHIERLGMVRGGNHASDFHAAAARPKVRALSGR